MCSYCFEESCHPFQGVPTRTWAIVVRPYDEEVLELALTYYGAMLRGGTKMIKYRKHHGYSFIALQALDEWTNFFTRGLCYGAAATVVTH